MPAKHDNKTIIIMGLTILVLTAIIIVLTIKPLSCPPGYEYNTNTGQCVPPPPPPNGIVTTNVTLGIGQANPTGTFTLNGVFADHVTGLQCYDYPVPNCSDDYYLPQGTPVSMTIGQQVSNGCTVIVKLVSINYAAQQATFEQSVDNTPNKPCPICWWQLDIMDTTTATKQ